MAVFRQNGLCVTTLPVRLVVRGPMRLVLNGRGARLILQNNDDMAVFARAGLARPELTRLVMGSGADLVRFTPRALSSPQAQAGHDV